MTNKRALYTIGAALITAVLFSIVSPGQSIQTAINSAVAGDTVHVNSGVYNERLNINKAITVVCDVKPCQIFGAVLAGNATLDGFYSLNNPYNDGALVANGSGNVIKNNKVENSCMVGIKLNGSSNLAENNEILKSRQCAGSSGQDADGIRYFGAGQVMRGNYIHDIFYNAVNTTAHIDCFQTWGGASNALIENNICDIWTYNSTLANSGANIENDTGAIFRNNYFRTYGKKIMIESSSSGTRIENNIFIGGAIAAGAPSQYGLFGSGSGEVATGNVFYNINIANGTAILYGVTNGGGNLLNSNPQMSGFCSVSYPTKGVLCGVLPPITPSASPSPLPVPSTATRTPVPPSPTGTPVPTLTPAFECLLFPVHNQRVCLP